ncbi:MAG: diacylglycerol kinase family protein [Halioglobus sp.]|nr:diacylglycerol kinase family protein [Halioglobus sp.]
MGDDAAVVGMISNPASGHNRNQFDAIEGRIARSPAIHHIVTDSAADIGPALAELAARNTGILAINGGDGTVSATLGQMLESGLFAQPPLVAVLPGGTANMNAGDIGIKGSLKKAVDTFCRWCETDQQVRVARATRHLLRVRDHAGTVHHSMFLGGGAIIHGTEYAHREIHSRGLRDDFSLAIGTLRTVWGVVRDDPRFNRHVRIDLALDEGPVQSFDTLILAVSTLQRLSFGMRPFWGEGPGAVRLTLMEQHCSRFARTFLSIIRGRPNRNAVAQSGYHSHNAGRIALQLAGPLNLDGEIIQCDGEIEITATGPLEFLQL